MFHFKRHSRFRLSHMPHAPTIGRNDDRRLVLYFLTTFIPSSLPMSSFLAACVTGCARQGICEVVDREPINPIKKTVHCKRDSRSRIFSPLLSENSGMTARSARVARRSIWDFKAATKKGVMYDHPSFPGLISNGSLASPGLFVIRSKSSFVSGSPRHRHIRYRNRSRRLARLRWGS